GGRKGAVLWTKTDVPGSSIVFGDREYLYIVDVSADGTPGNGRAVRAHDGVGVNVQDFSAAYKNRLAIACRNLLVMEPAPAAPAGAAARGKVLQIYDIQTGKDLWKKELLSAAFVLVSEEPDLTAVVEPSRNGQLTVVDLRSHRE